MINFGEEQQADQPSVPEMERFREIYIENKSKIDQIIKLRSLRKKVNELKKKGKKNRTISEAGPDK